MRWGAATGPSIELGRAVAEVGVKGTKPAVALHEIGDVAVDRRHTLYVLEPDIGTVSAFSSAGRYLFSVGRSGRAKGEFIVPQSLTVDERDRVYVYDIAQERLTQYHAAPDRLILQDSRHVGMSGSSICAMKGHIYLFGLNHERIVHDLSLDRRAMASFGEPFGRYTSLAEESLAAGKVLCVPQQNLLLVVPRIYPELRAYSPDGKVLWTTRLKHYRPATVYENADGSVTFSRPPTGYHHLLSAFLASPSVVCIQLGLATDNSHPDRIETRFISLHDGREVAEQEGLPLLTSPRPPLIYSLNKESGDRVMVYQFRYLEGSSQ